MYELKGVITNSVIVNLQTCMPLITGLYCSLSQNTVTPSDPATLGPIKSGVIRGVVTLQGLVLY